MSSADRDQPHEIADRLHSLAIHLLRRVRSVDERSGLSPARLSALSVLVFGGDCSITELAKAEQVRPPTMTRLVQGLEADGLLRRRPAADDGRAQRVSATAKGKRRLEQARQRRVQVVRELLAPLSPSEQEQLAATVTRLEALLNDTAADCESAD